MFWKQIPEGITTIEDMQGMTVCVEPTSAQDTVLDDYPLIYKKQTERVDDALLNIQYGKANAALVEQAIATKFKNKFPEIQLLDIPLRPEQQELGIGIAIKKNNDTLIQAVQNAVIQLDKKAILITLEKKWRI